MSEIKKQLQQLRTDYSRQELTRRSVDKNPFVQFEKWMKEALESQVNEPNAMTLATVSASGKPAARIVLLREITTDGFVFYTHYTSAKGRDIKDNPAVCLNFFWPELERQIRINGTAEILDAAASDAYFRTRPRESQISAWISPQSNTISSRDEMEHEYESKASEWEGQEIPRPPHWGGYLVKPDIFEFWQGRPGRLHDRIRYSLLTKSWIIERIAP